MSEALLKKQEMETKEVEKLCSFIQDLCRNSQSLAKTMEYTVEDMDAMRAEVQHWQKENKECEEALLQERRSGYCKQSSFINRVDWK